MRPTTALDRTRSSIAQLRAAENNTIYTVARPKSVSTMRTVTTTATPGPEFGTNTLAHHEALVARTTCPVLRLSGPVTREEALSRVLARF